MRVRRGDVEFGASGTSWWSTKPPKGRGAVPKTPHNLARFFRKLSPTVLKFQARPTLSPTRSPLSLSLPLSLTHSLARSPTHSVTHCFPASSAFHHPQNAADDATADAAAAGPCPRVLALPWWGWQHRAHAVSVKAEHAPGGWASSDTAVLWEAGRSGHPENHRRGRPQWRSKFIGVFLTWA